MSSGRPATCVRQDVKRHACPFSSIRELPTAAKDRGNINLSIHCTRTKSAHITTLCYPPDSTFQENSPNTSIPQGNRQAHLHHFPCVLLRFYDRRVLQKIDHRRPPLDRQYERLGGVEIIENSLEVSATRHQYEVHEMLFRNDVT